MNVAVLIGAGASYGAGGIAPESPPLGNQLFERLRRTFPKSWDALLDAREREAFAGDPPFESGMRMLWENNDERTQRLIIDMAIYFARFRPDGNSNHYAALLRILGQSGARVAFCSLNYECVFEQVAEQIRSGSMSKGGSAPGVPLLKPHGSCNYIEPMTRNMINVTFSGIGLAYSYNAAPSPNDLEIVPCTEVREIYAKVGLSMPPAMSLYEPTKHSPVNPLLIEQIRQAWAVSAQTADVILIIGARPVLEDSHIWNPIIRSRAPVWFVGGREDAYSALQQRLEKRLVELAPTFEAALPVLYSRRRQLAA